jgi:hypothetical protein
MGYDRIRFYDGIENQSTLITADKESAFVVYGNNFRRFLNVLGTTATLAADHDQPAKDIPAHVKPIAYPPKLKPFDSEVGYSSLHVIEVQPPLADDQLLLTMRYLKEYCMPSDAGPLFLDSRSDHNGCTIGYKGQTMCKH